MFYNLGLQKILQQDIDIEGASIRAMLVKDGYVFNHLIEAVDTGGNDDEDPSYIECDCTNYSAGYSGRKTPTISISASATENKVLISISDITWTSLGGTADNDVGGVIFVWKNTSDTDSIPLFYFDLGAVTTNGSDFTLEFSDIEMS